MDVDLFIGFCAFGLICFGLGILIGMKILIDWERKEDEF